MPHTKYPRQVENTLLEARPQNNFETQNSPCHKCGTIRSYLKFSLHLLSFKKVQIIIGSREQKINWMERARLQRSNWRVGKIWPQYLRHFLTFTGEFRISQLRSQQFPQPRPRIHEYNKKTKATAPCPPPAPLPGQKLKRFQYILRRE